MFNRSFNHALPIRGNRNVPYHRIASGPDLFSSDEKRLFSSPRNSYEGPTTTKVLRRAKADSRPTSSN
jgi:hypothetical protein